MSAGLTSASALRRTTLSLVAASFVGYVGYKSLEGPAEVAHPSLGPARATSLRKEAFAACDKGNAAVCKDKLNQAKELDPEGEQDREVRQARARIQQLEAASAGER